MQPYLFPYIGYWQLVGIADVFILYDDVSYIKNGYINRNYILANNTKQRFTLNVLGASSNRLINEIKVGDNAKIIVKTIRQEYSKAPYFKDVFDLIEDIFLNDEKNLAEYLAYSIKTIANYFNLNTKLLVSSEITKDNTLGGQDKIISICKLLQASQYINATGGQSFYSKEIFLNANIQLNFLNTKPVIYRQFTNKFVPSLSIIDVMMFNSKEKVVGLLDMYELI